MTVDETKKLAEVVRAVVKEELGSINKKVSGITEQVSGLTSQVTELTEQSHSLTEQVAHLTEQVEGVIIPTLEKHTAYFKRLTET
jgi:uncharacterized protein YoxC